MLVLEWVSALATAGAFLVGGLLLWHEMHIRNIDRRDQQISQARCVLVTIHPAVKQGFATDPLQMPHVDVVVANYSASPIIDVELAVRDCRYDDQWFVRFLPMVPPGRPYLEPWLFTAGRRLPWPKQEDALHAALMNDFEPMITFTDGNGLRWARRGRLNPERVFWADPRAWYRRGFDRFRSVIPRQPAAEEGASLAPASNEELS